MSYLISVASKPTRTGDPALWPKSAQKFQFRAVYRICCNNGITPMLHASGDVEYEGGFEQPSTVNGARRYGPASQDRRCSQVLRQDAERGGRPPAPRVVQSVVSAPPSKRTT